MLNNLKQITIRLKTQNPSTSPIKWVFLPRLDWANYQLISKLLNEKVFENELFVISIFKDSFRVFFLCLYFVYFRNFMLISNGVVRSIESQWVKCWWKCGTIQVYSKPIFWFYRLHQSFFLINQDSMCKDFTRFIFYFLEKFFPKSSNIFSIKFSTHMHSRNASAQGLLWIWYQREFFFLRAVAASQLLGWNLFFKKVDEISNILLMCQCLLL